MPIFDLEQKQRFDEIQSFIEKLKNSAILFERYSRLGIELVSILKSIQNDLQKNENYRTSVDFTTLTTKMKQISDAFATHFQFVIDKISRPLQNEVSMFCENLSKQEREFSSKASTYKKSEEQFVSLSPTNKNQTKASRQAQMIHAHTKSSLSFYDFFVTMEEFDLKMKYLLPKINYDFIETWMNSFFPLALHFKEEENNFSSLKKNIETSFHDYGDYTKNTSTLKQNLCCQIPIFWEKISSSFTLTNVFTA